MGQQQAGSFTSRITSQGRPVKRTTDDTPYLFGREVNKWVKSIDDLYKDADERRVKLFLRVLIACTDVLDEKKGSNEASNDVIGLAKMAPGQGLEHALLGLSEEDLQAVVARLNEVAKDEDGKQLFFIELPPVKSRRSTEEKFNRTVGKKLSEINDIVRMRIVTEEPDTAQLIINRIGIVGSDFSDSGWRIRQVGHMDRSLYVAVGGLTASLQFLDPGQRAAVDEFHPVYECMRKVMSGDSQAFDPSYITEQDRIEMERRYNVLFGYAYGNGYPLEQKTTEDFATEHALHERYYELHALQQWIHAKAIASSSEAWQALYSRLAYRKNDFCSDDRLLIPPEYLRSRAFIEAYDVTRDEDRSLH